MGRWSIVTHSEGAFNSWLILGPGPGSVIYSLVAVWHHGRSDCILTPCKPSLWEFSWTYERYLPLSFWFSITPSGNHHLQLWNSMDFISYHIQEHILSFRRPLLSDQVLSQYPSRNAAPDPCVPAAEWCEFCAHVLLGSALASCGQCGGFRSHFGYRSRPSSLSVPQPPSQDCRLPTASWAISMYDKCRVRRQANLVSALPRWSPGLRYHWKIIYRCEERRGKKCQFRMGENDSYFPRPFFFCLKACGSLKLSSRCGENSGDSAELVCFHACFI